MIINLNKYGNEKKNILLTHINLEPKALNYLFIIYLIHKINKDCKKNKIILIYSKF